MSTPRDDGLSMPAEFAPHAATYMEWPTRVELWGDLFEQAKLDYAEVANAIAAFEPLVMVTDPDQADEARSFLTARVEILPIPIDDSWMRDNGPIFVTDGDGGIALVQFRFNSWGEKFLPYDRDADVPKNVAEHIGMRRYEAPMVLEGGSFFVDGEGTLFTTEQCLLNPEPQPVDDAPADRGDAPGVPRRRRRDLARGGPLDRP
jgi:agmatine deiminase